MLGEGVSDDIVHRVGIYVLKQRWPGLLLSQIAEDAGHGCNADMLLALRFVQVFMAEDPVFAELVRGLCRSQGDGAANKL